MIAYLFQSGLSLTEMVMFAAMIIVVMAYSLSVHEMMHGYAAYRFGDDTARLAGRLTMNPLVHLDPFGTIMIILVGFGWAKPVPVNYGRLTKWKSRSAMIRVVSLAGVFANFVSAWVAYILYITVSLIFPASPIAYIFIQLLYFLYYFNLLLMAFNLIPLPPLDGYHVLETLIPYKYRATFNRYERYFSFGLLGLIIIGMISGFSPLFWLVRIIQIPFNFIIQKPVELILSLLG